MSKSNSTTNRRSDAERTPLILDGVSHDELTEGFLREIHRAADNEGLSLENISVGSR